MRSSIKNVPDRSLQGKRVGMVSFSEYPDDPRPRRAIGALLEEGMEVDFICLGDGRAPTRETFPGFSILRLRIEHRRGGPLSYAYQYSLFILATAAILAFRSLRCRYDLVYIHNMPDILVTSALIPKLLGAKVILDQHDPTPELMTTIFGVQRHSRAVRVIQYLEKWSLAQAHLVIAVNIACKHIFGVRSCGPEKVGIVMNSPDEKIFGIRPRLPRLRDTTVKQFVIMYHGSIVERNGLDLAVEALARLQPKISAAELRVFGRRTPFLDTVLKQARDKGVESYIHYCGPRQLETLVREIEGCDLGVVPNTRSDFSDINTPTRIFEYLALGKPVIAPRTRGIEDYFKPDSLLFFEPGNASDLARQIEFVWDNSAEALRITERGQAVYVKHRWSQEKKTFVNLVARLLTGNEAQ